MKSWRILFVVGGFHFNQLKAHFAPLISMQSVKKIDVILNCNGPKLNKVFYHFPPLLFQQKFLRRLWKLFNVCLFTFVHKPELVIYFETGLLPFQLDMIFLKLFLRKVKIGLWVLSERRLLQYAGWYAYTFPPGKVHYLAVKMEPIFFAILKHLDFMLSVGKKAKKYLTEKILNNGERLNMISPMIEEINYTLSHFKETSDGTNSAVLGERVKEFDLIYVGWLEKRKNIMLLLQIVNKLKELLPGVKLVIVGSGPEEKLIRNEIKVKKMEDNVCLVGYRTDVQNYLKRAKVFALTSYYEGISIACAEAMLCKLPVVCFDVGSMSELVMDGFNGFLVPPFNAELFFNRLYFLLSHNQQIIRMGENAYKFASEKFRKALVMQQWENFFNRIKLKPVVKIGKL